MEAGHIVHIVDDDEPVRTSLEWLLTAAGLTARVYPTPGAFLEATEGRPQGCVLLDLQMPGVDGIEVLKRLGGRGSTAPVIMMTGHGDGVDAAEALASGAVDFIEKPFDAERLLSAIGRALSSRGLSQP